MASRSGGIASCTLPWYATPDSLSVVYVQNCAEHVSCRCLQMALILATQGAMRAHLVFHK